MKALVVGGTGPTGPFIIEGLLKRGYQVSIFHRGTHEIELPQEVEHLHGDPHFIETLNHTLGARTFDLTIAMYGRLRYVAEVMKERTERFICTGGPAVYEEWAHPDRYFATEAFSISENGALTYPSTMNNEDMHPFMRFSSLMVQSELTVMENHRRGFYSGTLFRFPMIYGPRQLIPAEWSIIRRVLDGRKRLIIPDGGLTIESRGYSENMANGVLLAVDHPEESAGQIYNISDEDALSLRDWVGVISRVMEHNFEFVDMPAKLAVPSMPYGLTMRPFLDETGQLHHRVLDLQKIKAQLAYKDIFKVRDGLKNTVEYYVNNPPEPGGETEQRLHDPFDYDAEDKLISEYEKSLKKLSTIFPEGPWRHPYPHPEKPNQRKDQRGR